MTRPAPFAFSWGYSGWGNHTAELVRMVDAVEAARGFRPPLFVDVRLRRGVRAVGFRDRAFEKLMGPDRYLWLPGLGNRAIAEGGKMRLFDPAAVDGLVERVVAARERRVIFFCSCESPKERHTCHRGLVVDLLVKTAKRRSLALSVQEWPGGSPVIADVDVSPEEMKLLERAVDGLRLPLGDRLDLATAGALPHYSILRLRDRSIYAAAGPVIHTTRGWMIPIETVSTALEELEARCEAWRETFELDACGDEPTVLDWRRR